MQKPNSMTTTSTAKLLPVPEINTTQLHLFAVVCSTVTRALESIPAPIMNSLVSTTMVLQRITAKSGGDRLYRSRIITRSSTG